MQADNNGALILENLGKRVQIKIFRLKQGDPSQIIEDSTRVVGGFLEAYELRKNDIVIAIRGLGQISYPRLLEEVFVTVHPEPQIR